MLINRIRGSHLRYSFPTALKKNRTLFVSSHIISPKSCFHFQHLRWTNISWWSQPEHKIQLCCFRTANEKEALPCFYWDILLTPDLQIGPIWRWRIFRGFRLSLVPFSNCFWLAGPWERTRQLGRKNIIVWLAITEFSGVYIALTSVCLISLTHRDIWSRLPECVYMTQSSLLNWVAWNVYYER